MMTGIPCLGDVHGGHIRRQRNVQTLRHIDKTASSDIAVGNTFDFDHRPCTVIHTTAVMLVGMPMVTHKRDVFDADIFNRLMLAQFPIVFGKDVITDRFSERHLLAIQCSNLMNSIASMELELRTFWTRKARTEIRCPTIKVIAVVQGL